MSEEEKNILLENRVAKLEETAFNPFLFPQLDPLTRTNFLRNIIRPVSGIVQGDAAATAVNYGIFFVSDKSYKVISITERHRTAGTGAGTVTVSVEKAASGTAADSGKDLLSTALSLKATAATVQYGALTATQDDLLLAKGDCLILKDSGTLTAVADVCVTVLLMEF